MVDYTNDARAKRAHKAVRSYANVSGQASAAEMPYAFRDLLGDMMHLADTLGYDFADELRIATNYYEEESRAAAWALLFGEG